MKDLIKFEKLIMFIIEAISGIIMVGSIFLTWYFYDETQSNFVMFVTPILFFAIIIAFNIISTNLIGDTIRELKEMKEVSKDDLSNLRKSIYKSIEPLYDIIDPIKLIDLLRKNTSIGEFRIKYNGSKDEYNYIVNAITENILNGKYDEYEHYRIEQTIDYKINGKSMSLYMYKGKLILSIYVKDDFYYIENDNENTINRFKEKIGVK